MTRLILRTIDVGASIVFMALCAKAFCVHFYNDLRRASPAQPYQQPRLILSQPTHGAKRSSDG
jgi:hypothetical protein